MAGLTKQEIIVALKRLGELADQRGSQVELLLMGGAAMVLMYNARLSTQDVDVFILSPPETRVVRELAKQVAQEYNLPEDWLNDGAKGYLMGLSQGPTIFSDPGIIVKSFSATQLLAMKLSAWRDDVDIEDARRLLQEMPGKKEDVWAAIQPFLVPGTELKAQYAFWDLWEALYGTD